MANLNTGIFSNIIGQLKLLTILIGIVDLGLTADKYLKDDSREEYFLAMVIICFIVSMLFIILSLLSLLNENDTLNKVDMAYHVIAGLLLIIGAIVWFASISGKWQKCHWGGGQPNGKCKTTGAYVQRIFSGLFGMLNGVVYVVVGALIFRAG